MTGQVGPAGTWEVFIQLDVSGTASYTLPSRAWGRQVELEELEEEDQEMGRVREEDREVSRWEQRNERPRASLMAP